jgi:2-polyprenyl-3-methyl-5-hydroxy-6-metoxy-1,4-benzoquinol methylase
MACPICGGVARTLEVTHQGMDLYRCGDSVRCGSVYMDPMPTLETRHEMYDDPYAGATSGYYAKAEKKLRRARKRARILSDFVATDGKAFLEVGSSGGFMVEAMRERGFTATGVEPDKPGVMFAQKHYPQNRFINGFLEEVSGQLGQYDAVYCSEVIEHVPAPDPFVAAIARLMKPGAVFNVTTPDVAHWNKPKDIRQWNEFCPPSHCLYFTPQGLRTLLAKHGLTIVRHRFNWKAGIQFYARKTA